MEWSEKCCLCGRMRPSYNNPDPVRDGAQDCCDECNRLVIRVRQACARLPREEREAYVLRLRGMTYRELTDAFGAEKETVFYGTTDGRQE